MTQPTRHSHFIGIGGIGMSAIAQVLLARGERISGSDLVASEVTRRLEGLGARISIGHAPGAAAGADRVVLSDAIRPDNPELAWAREHGIEIVRRSQVLAEILGAGRGIAVAGSHGKTTTSGMIALILERAGLDPTALLGGELPAFGSNARVGRGEFVVAEACEAYNSFLDLEPEIAVVTNIEPDHLDFHHTFEALQARFEEFLQRIKPGGCAVLGAEDPLLREWARELESRAVTFGVASEADFVARNVEAKGLASEFEVVRRGETLGRARVGAPGRHNVANAICAIAAALQVGAPFAAAAEALAEFRGMKRRFEVVVEAGGITVVDDYAHHPTEIRATLATARPLCRGRLIAVFQPHLFSRTRFLLDDFAQAFGDADRVIVTEIYPAREDPIPGVTGDLLARRLLELSPGKEVAFMAPKDQIAEALAPSLRPGDWVLTLGAGPVDSVAADLSRQLSQLRAPAASGRVEGDHCVRH
jgi:UDP-N-acetylmuramate--alanine ligase